MTKRDRLPERNPLAGHPDNPVETPGNLAATLARIRQEALARVTAQLSGRDAAPDETASLFGDIRRSVGKAVKERTETAGLPLTLSGSLGG